MGVMSLLSRIALIAFAATVRHVKGLILRNCTSERTQGTPTCGVTMIRRVMMQYEPAVAGRATRPCLGRDRWPEYGRRRPCLSASSYKQTQEVRRTAEIVRAIHASSGSPHYCNHP